MTPRLAELFYQALICCAQVADDKLRDDLFYEVACVNYALRNPSLTAEAAGVVDTPSVLPGIVRRAIAPKR